MSGVGRTLVELYLALSAVAVEELYFRGLLHRVGAFIPASTCLYLKISPLLFTDVHRESERGNRLLALTSSASSPPPTFSACELMVEYTPGYTRRLPLVRLKSWHMPFMCTERRAVHTRPEAASRLVQVHA